MQTTEERVAYRKQYYLDNKERTAAAYKATNVKNNPANNLKHNPIRMTVGGKYVSRKHPLWKIGNYKSFNDAAFSSFVNLNKTTEGAVYLITNDAWVGWIKVGKAGDAEDRLKGYQTGDPHRSYTLKHYVTVDDRHTSEVKAHKALEALSEARQNEWFKVDLTTAIGCIEALHE
jgi:hypothetical protein